MKSDLCFDCLHDVLQDVMGWEHFHPYEFIVKGERIVNPDAAEYAVFNEKFSVTTDVILCERLKRVGQKFTYIYDFGDLWEHEVLFEKRFPFDENQLLPFCIEGEMACPPEDCGGIDRFHLKMELLDLPPGEAESRFEDMDDLREWFGNYDPRHFEINEVNSCLKPRKYNGEFDIEIADNYLSFVSDSISLKTFFQETAINDTPENRNKLLELVFSTDDFIFDNKKDKIYDIDYILKRLKTRIQPTPMEIDKGILVPGHRLIPFFDEEFDIENLELLYHYKPLDLNEITFKWGNVAAFFSMINTCDIPIENPGDIMNPEQEIGLFVWDLEEFYRVTNFKAGDSILLKAEDISDDSFTIKYVSAAKMKKQEERIQKADRFFLENLRKVLKMDIPFASLSLQLLYTFYEMLQVESKALELPGSSLADLIEGAGDIEIFSPAEAQKLLRLKKGSVV